MNNKLLLYYPKEKPLAMLSFISQKFASLPIKYAFYCMSSILYNKNIIEKLIIGIELEETSSSKKSQIIEELNQNINHTIWVVSTSE